MVKILKNSGDSVEGIVLYIMSAILITLFLLLSVIYAIRHEGDLSSEEKIELLTPKNREAVEDYMDYLYYLQEKGVRDILTTGRYIFDDQYSNSNTKLRSSSNCIKRRFEG